MRGAPDFLNINVIIGVPHIYDLDSRSYLGFDHGLSIGLAIFKDTVFLSSVGNSAEFLKVEPGLGLLKASQ